PVVIDAAGAFDNQTDAGRSCAVFSLHATKSLAAGEGGFVVTTDSGLLAEVRRLSNFGIELPGGMVPSVGTNAKLSEYHAAVALASLDGWSARRERRVAVHRQYLDALARYCPTVVLQQRPPEGVYSTMPVLLPERASAQTALERLASQGIETRRWYCPTLEKHPAFRDLPIAGELRVSRTLSDRLLALPFHAFLGPEDVDAVCAALAAVIEATISAAR
ncbi:MAG: DegT/DnrJ/EryC1/StrS family aminotransferase, partial [Burkholderiales bacterium]